MAVRRAAVLLLVLAAPLALVADDLRTKAGVSGVDFSDEFLIAIEGNLSSRQEASGGWLLRPIVTTHPHGSRPDTGRGETAPQTEQVRQWLLASPTPRPRTEVAVAEPAANPWDLAHHLVAGKAPKRYEALRAQVARNASITELEPSVVYYDTQYAEKREALLQQQDVCTPRAASGSLTVCSGPSLNWPSLPRFAWNNDLNGLTKARHIAAASFSSDCTKNVVIAHLDTGYDKATDTTTPRCFDQRASRSFLANENDGGFDHFTGRSSGHGPGTLSVLAGGQVKFRHAGYPDYDDDLGGAPLAHVFSYRITDSVVVIWPKRMAEAITTATENGADVISMSIGGTPSGALRDAVNSAYDNGTAMVFATGDFFRLPIPLLPARTPHTLVYPARFSRTLSVAGITASMKSYGDNPGWRSLFRHRGLGSWMLRGSYGPASSMQHAVSAFAPNVTRHHATKNQDHDLIDLDFGGTSAATPQVAATAALWLQTHRDELQSHWRSWEKAESVYRAILDSADTGFSGYGVERFGRGVLNAPEALRKGVPDGLSRQAKASIGFDWVTVASNVLGADPEDNPSEMSEPERALHAQMLRTEIAQLTNSSRALQQILAVAPDANHIDDATKTRFLQALVNDPRASNYLRRSFDFKVRHI